MATNGPWILRSENIIVLQRVQEPAASHSLLLLPLYRTSSRVALNFCWWEKLSSSLAWSCCTLSLSSSQYLPVCVSLALTRADSPEDRNWPSTWESASSREWTSSRTWSSALTAWAHGMDRWEKTGRG